MDEPEVLAELRALEPIFHGAAPGAPRTHFEAVDPVASRTGGPAGSAVSAERPAS